MTHEVYAENLRKGDTIIDGDMVGTIVSNPFVTKRNKTNVTFLVRVGPTIYNVSTPHRTTILTETE